MKKLFVFLISLTISFSAYSTDFVNVIVKDIAKHNVYESVTVGFAAAPSTQHMRLNQLLMLANDTQLMSLTKHSNAVVRLYALHGIISRKLPITEEIRDQFFMDNTLVSTLQGCIGNKLTVGLISKAIFTEKSI